MKNKKWKRRLLALVLSAALVVPNFSVTAFASETDLTVSADETGQAVVEERDFVVSEETDFSTENETDEVLETNEVSTEDTELETMEETTFSNGYFENVEMTFEGIMVNIKGFFQYGGSETGEAVYVRLAQYDENDQHLCSTSVLYISESYASRYEIDSYRNLLHDKAAYVRLEAGYYYGTGKVVSEDFDVPAFSQPEDNYEVEVSKIGAGSVNYEISYKGNVGEDGYVNLNTSLNVGTTEDPDTWQEVNNEYVEFSAYDTVEIVSFSGLIPETTYYGEIIFYYSIYDNENYENIRCYEKRIPLDSFTTKKNEVYQLSEIFPDETFRIKIAGSASVETITKTDLERIQYIDIDRSSLETTAVKDITGIDLLVNLENFSAENQEISDVSHIDWSKLCNLKQLDMSGNDLTKVPDLTQNSQLEYVYFRENLLPVEEVNNIYKKMPKNIESIENAVANQRVNGFELVIEDTYYVYPTGTDIYAEAVGYKTDFDYTVKLYLDGVETTFEDESDRGYGNFYSLKNSSVAEGNHTLKAALYLGAEKKAETAEYAFNVVNEEIFSEDFPIYVSTDTRENDSLYLLIGSTSREKEIAAINMVNASGEIYAEGKIGSNFDGYNEPRFEKFDNYPLNEDVRIRMTNTDLDLIYNTTPEGSYDLEVEFTDGTSVNLENTVIVLPKTETIIDDCYVASNYDSTGEYLYLDLRGYNIQPEKLSYQISQSGRDYSVTYVNHKPRYNNSVVVKLKKEGWKKYASRYDQVRYVVSGGTEASTAKEDIYGGLDEGIYYIEHNFIKQQVMVAVTESMAKENTVKAYLKYGYSDDAPILAEAEAEIENGIAYLNFVQEDGSKYLFRNGEYYLTYELGAIKDTRYFWASGNTDMGLAQADELNAYSAETVDNNCDLQSEAEVIRYINTEAGMMPVGMEEDYEELAVQEVETAEKAKFIVNYFGFHWESDSEIYGSVSSPSVKEGDKYTVTLADREGNPVPGLTIKTNYTYNGGASFSIKGLKHAEAAKKYFIKIVHNSLGEAVASDGITPYFADEKGAYMEIYYSQMSYGMYENRVVGLYLTGHKLPIKLALYKPYETDLIKEVTISKEEQIPYGYYTITKAFADSLPVKDVQYDIVKKLSDGRYYSMTNFFDCRDNLLTKWNYTVSKTTLYINDEADNTAEVQVTGNNGKPTFKTSDSSVVAVTVDENNPNKAILTAKGVGTAQISITADGATRKFTVVCERKAVLESLVLNQNEVTLSVGDTKELKANVFPAEAWKEDMRISFSVENQNILSVDGVTGNSVIIRAIAPGETVVTASLIGTEFTAQCVVSVENSFTAVEKEVLIGQASENYVLANAAVALKDVKLPAGWTWVDPDKTLTADNNLPVQYYSAQYKADGYSAFTAVLPVKVSKLTKVQILGDTVLESEERSEYQVQGVYVGYQPAADEFVNALNCVWDIDTLEAVKSTSTKDGKFVVETKAVESNSVAKVLLALNLGGKEYKAELPITVIANPYVDKIELGVAEAQPETAIKYYTYKEEGELPEIIVNSKDINTDKNEVSNTLKVEAKAYAKETLLELQEGFKWTTSDKSVVTVKADSDGLSAVLTFKKAGSALVCIESTDGGKYVQEILVSVKDYEPILESNKITLDLYAEKGMLLPLKAQNGNAITNLIVEEQDAASKEWIESSKFEVEGLCLKAKTDYTPSKNEKVKVQLKLTTDEGEFVKAATINVNVKTKPTAILKTDIKANLFYADTQAYYRLTSKYEIESIKDITVQDGENNRGRNDEEDGFRLSYFNSDSGLVIFDTGETLTAETLDAFKAKNSALNEVTLQISFKGYTEAADQIVTLKVATENKKPSMKLNDVTILWGQNSTDTQVYDTKAKCVYPVYEEDGMAITSKTTGVDLTITENGEVKVYYNLLKNTNYNAELTSKNWTQPVALKGKIKVNDVLKQKVTLDNAKVTLNTTHSIQKNGKLAVGISIDNNNTAIEKLSYEVDKKNAALFNQGYLSITFSESTQKVYLGLNEGMGENIKPGTYKVYLIGKINLSGQEQSLKPVLLTIVLSDKAPAVTLKSSGSVDLVRRDSTSILYKPTYKNVTAKAEKLVLSGSYAEYFSGNLWENGEFSIFAKEGYPMSTKVTYPLTVTLVLDNGCEVTSTVNIKPVNKLPKVKVENGTQTIYKSNAQSVSYQLLNADINTKIAKVVLAEDKNSQYFDYEFLAGDVVRVTLKDARKVKPGKYTLNY